MWGFASLRDWESGAELQQHLGIHTPTTQPLNGLD